MRSKLTAIVCRIKCVLFMLGYLLACVLIPQLVFPNSEPDIAIIYTGLDLTYLLEYRSIDKRVSALFPVQHIVLLVELESFGKLCAG